MVKPRLPRPLECCTFDAAPVPSVFVHPENQADGIATEHRCSVEHAVMALKQGCSRRAAVVMQEEGLNQRFRPVRRELENRAAAIDGLAAAAAIVGCAEEIAGTVGDHAGVRICAVVAALKPVENGFDASGRELEDGAAGVVGAAVSAILR